MNKTAIKNFAISARKKLIAMAVDKAGIIGITKEAVTEPTSRGKDFAVYPTHFGTEAKLYDKDVSHRQKLVGEIRKNGYDAVMEEVAYTWFNRLIAVRFMEVNDYLPTRVRVLSSETAGKFEPDLVTQAPNVELGFTEAEKEEIYALKDDPRKSGELFKKLFIMQCNALGEILPELFEHTADYTELLLDLSWDKEDSVVRELVKPESEGGISEADFQTYDLEGNEKLGGQIEIIGWMWQYYNDDRRNEVINIYKGTVKKEDIPAATQLFTTDWVVRYMVDNSLGRYWLERNPQSKLAEKLGFLVTPKDGHLQSVDERIDPTELTFFDPCMGSGHILVYAFDVLMEIYRECGYADHDAASSIIQNNLYGLDIDNRAYQLAYFAVMMRARHFDRRALSREFSPNVFATSRCPDGEEYGSLLTVNVLEEMPQPPEELTLFNMDYTEKLNVWNFRRLLAQKYCIVCTNPPYLNKMNPKLKDYVLANYKDYSGDLFSVFMYHNFSFCKQGGYSAFMTPFVWMFIKTYERLREYIIQNKSIATLVQMEYSAFEEATVPICSFVLRNGKSADKGLYFKLSDFKGGMEVQKQKVLEAIADKDCGYFYETDAENFKKIPGAPIAYWVSERVCKVFSESKALGSFAVVKHGLTTGKNEFFVRYWAEISYQTIDFSLKDRQEIECSNAKYFPYNKGGSFRKWYGNSEYVLWYNAQGQEKMASLSGHRHDGKDMYFHEGITWSFISSSHFGVRYTPTGFVFDVAGSSLFARHEMTVYLTGLLCSKLGDYFLTIQNPTLNFQVGNLARIPVRYNLERERDIFYVVEQNISISRTDWDSFETSWDFKRHPLVALAHSVSKAHIGDADESWYLKSAFEAWDYDCQLRFDTLKANEEELNRIFIDIYGLQDELTPEVEDKDVTVRRADLAREIRSFISYAVGCMFGRYSLDVEGLAYAGGDWDAGKYTRFLPDRDNVLPITDEAYFPDDIVTRFIEFVKTVYGGETLEENLDFIARALGNKGDSARQVIRNYFLRDFYKDHCKIYQKRPIYWIFDSGKEDGFKALIYLHRYDPDTVGRVRADYLHKQQGFLENAVQSCDYTLENSENARDKVDATKKKDKLVRQLAETRLYDQALAHIALRRIPLDLDDGVKVNYEKFQGIEVKNEGTKAVKIDLLGKI